MNMDLSKDVPELNQAQFTALHMAVSMNGLNYALSEQARLDSMLRSGWCVIAKGYMLTAPGLHYLYLAPPVQDDEEGDDGV